jgi:hypothetical protein
MNDASGLSNAGVYNPRVSWICSREEAMRQRVVILCVGVIMAVGSTANGQWLNYPTPGIPRLPDGTPNLKAPAPRMADGKPDLSGIWTWCPDCSSGDRLFFDLARGLDPAEVQMTPWAAAIAAQRSARDHVDDPYGYCLPPGVPRLYFVTGSFRILPTAGLTAFLHETAVGLIFRQIYTDGRPLPAVTIQSWLGYSVGRWDGDTFVVDTNGFRDGGWLDTLKARPHSDALRVTERFRRIDFGHMDLAITIDDPKAFSKPWTLKTNFELLPDTDLIESFCDTQQKTMEHRQIDPPPPEPPSPPRAF